MDIMLNDLVSAFNNWFGGPSDGKQIDVILLDYAEVLDKVSHQRLFSNLIYGVRG